MSIHLTSLEHADLTLTGLVQDLVTTRLARDALTARQLVLCTARTAEIRRGRGVLGEAIGQIRTESRCCRCCGFVLGHLCGVLGWIHVMVVIVEVVVVVMGLLQYFVVDKSSVGEERWVLVMLWGIGRVAIGFASCFESGVGCRRGRWGCCCEAKWL